MEKIDKEYEFAAKKIYDNLRCIICGYSARIENNNDTYNFERLEHILCNIYLDITRSNSDYDIKNISFAEKISIKNINETLKNYCSTKEKTQKISDYYKLVIQYFIKQQLDEDLSSSLTNVYNRILEIDKENQNNKIISKPKAIERSI